VSRFLVDTQLLLWSASGSRRLPAAVGRLFRDGRHEFYVSAASLWEVAIKASLGRADFQVDAARLREVLGANGFRELPITGAHAVTVSTLPSIHADPFDRMLVAQANTEPMILVTADKRLGQYPGTIEVVGEES
jgi:PIN domain nuclease of toxin-antitoxin system